MYQTTLHTYINISSQCASCIPKPSSSYPFSFATNISYPCRISPKPPLTTQFSHHIPANVFDLTFYISAVFQIALLI